MKNLFTKFLVVFLLVFIGQIAYAGEFRDISTIQLIATPELFNGQNVRVIGFLHFEFEGDAVYFHQEDFENSIEQNSVSIELNKYQMRAWRGLNNKYVIIEGRFSSIVKGHLDMRSGSLQNITRLGNWSARRTRNRAPNVLAPAEK